MTVDSRASGPSRVPAVGWDAIIVSGGRASRLGGIDKTALVFEGETLLHRAVDATAGATRAVVVGPARPARDGVRFTREHPAGGGPAAAIVAGLAALAEPCDEVDLVAVLASDLPHAAAALDLLLAALPSALGQHDGLVAVDAGGRRQPLLAVYRKRALTRAAAEHPSPDGLSVRALLGSLTLAELRIDDDLLADVDVAADAARLGITLPPSG